MRRPVTMIVAAFLTLPALAQTPANPAPASLVREGVEIVLTEGATPLARLAPIAAPTTPRVAGLHAGAIWTSEDFDEPLPEDLWTETT